MTGLVGANGAGKSTLIKILLGLLPATVGRRAGCSTSTWPPTARGSASCVGYMPEHDCLPPDVSATEFVVHMARMSGLPPTAARERAADTLRHVGLYEERYRPIGGYSTGMKQRVKLAQALVHDPQLVLLDEPTNGLDPAGRDDMLALIRRIGTEFGISVLVTSHLLGELERVCDHVVVIDGGRLLRSAATADVTAATQSSRSRSTDAAPTARRRAARRAGLDVARRSARCSQVELADETTYDLVRDVVADSASDWCGWSARRHHMAESSATARCAVGEPTPAPRPGRSTTSATGATTGPASAGPTPRGHCTCRACAAPSASAAPAVQGACR